ncbi:hypothetical protein EVAR_103442_1 [Eumeta japonica]|uniref:Uncharacterized protein n=1 Tax=Eumeta variegata TaxID=151549 RepID=A0A4C1Z5R4_EUMVA|nr:hypothetical protein EVAR_103442_1 [Eumeta japonica]
MYTKQQHQTLDGRIRWSNLTTLSVLLKARHVIASGVCHRIHELLLAASDLQQAFVEGLRVDNPTLGIPYFQFFPVNLKKKAFRRGRIEQENGRRWGTNKSIREQTQHPALARARPCYVYG